MYYYASTFFTHFKFLIRTDSTSGMRPIARKATDDDTRTGSEILFPHVQAASAGDRPGGRGLPDHKRRHAVSRYVWRTCGECARVRASESPAGDPGTGGKVHSPFQLLPPGTPDHARRADREVFRLPEGVL